MRQLQTRRSRPNNLKKLKISNPAMTKMRNLKKKRAAKKPVRKNQPPNQSLPKSGAASHRTVRRAPKGLRRTIAATCCLVRMRTAFSPIISWITNFSPSSKPPKLITIVKKTSN